MQIVIPKTCEAARVIVPAAGKKMIMNDMYRRDSGYFNNTTRRMVASLIVLNLTKYTPVEMPLPE